MPNLVVLCETVWAQVGVPKIERAGAPSHWDFGVADPGNYMDCRVTVPNSIVVGQTVQACLLKSAGNIGPLASRLSRSLEVIGTDTDRSGA